MALRRAIVQLARGNGLVVIPYSAELTTQAAANLLHVSRPYFVRLLDEGVIPSKRVGRHRRVTLQDVLTYQEKRAAEFEANMREISQLSQLAGYE